jgi:hypothetical protein
MADAHTEWGDPDLEGIWLTANTAGFPLQRPADDGDESLLRELVDGGVVEATLLNEGVPPLPRERDCRMAIEEWRRTHFGWGTLVVEPQDGVCRVRVERIRVPRRQLRAAQHTQCGARSRATDSIGRRATCPRDRSDLRGARRRPVRESRPRTHRSPRWPSCDGLSSATRESSRRTPSLSSSVVR